MNMEQNTTVHHSSRTDVFVNASTGSRDAERCMYKIRNHWRMCAWVMKISLHSSLCNFPEALGEFVWIVTQAECFLKSLTTNHLFIQ